MKLTQILGSQTPSYLRIPPQSPSPRTRRIHENASERAPEGKRESPIQLNNFNSAKAQSLKVLLYRGKPVRVPVRRNDYRSRSRSPG